MRVVVPRDSKITMPVLLSLIRATKAPVESIEIDKENFFVYVEFLTKK